MACAGAADVGRGEHALGQAWLDGASGPLVDATIIATPSSTQNKQGKRDRKMDQTKKGNPRYFGIKVHIGVRKFGNGQKTS